MYFQYTSLQWLHLPPVVAANSTRISTSKDNHSMKIDWDANTEQPISSSLAMSSLLLSTRKRKRNESGNTGGMCERNSRRNQHDEVVEKLGSFFGDPSEAIPQKDLYFQNISFENVACRKGCWSSFLATYLSDSPHNCERERGPLG